MNELMDKQTFDKLNEYGVKIVNLLEQEFAQKDAAFAQMENNYIQADAKYKTLKKQLQETLRAIDNL